jgi:3D (Asp-Asp-Asp) domain-containing protein
VGSARVAGTEGEGLRLRAGPGLGHAVQMTLTEGTRVRVEEGPETADDHEWLRVSGSMGRGWAAARYLVLAEERLILASAGGVPLRTLQMRVVGYHFPPSSSPRTSTGTIPQWGTVAVDPWVIPLGSRLLIEGFEDTIFIAEDTGSAVRGSIVDVWFDDIGAARHFGTQHRTVTLLDR